MKMEIEEWRDIPGYETFYMASTLGRIKRLSYAIDNRGKMVTLPEIIRKPHLKLVNGI